MNYSISGRNYSNFSFEFSVYKRWRVTFKRRRARLRHVTFGPSSSQLKLLWRTEAQHRRLFLRTNGVLLSAAGSFSNGFLLKRYLFSLNASNQALGRLGTNA